MLDSFGLIATISDCLHDWVVPRKRHADSRIGVAKFNSRIAQEVAVSSIKSVRGVCCCASAAVLAIGVCCSARAESFSYGYGDRVAQTVTYGSVTETSIVNTTAAYGSPSVSKDSLYCDLISLGVFSITASSATSELKWTEGALSSRISANSGYAVNSLTILENGVYDVNGSGTSVTYAKVTLSGVLKITEVDGKSITPVTDSFSETLTYTLSNGSGDWNIPFTLDLDSILAASGISGNVTAVTLTLDNMLYAASETTSIAYIAKDMIQVDATTSVIDAAPEPSTIAMLGVAGIGLAIAAWRKRRAAASNAA
jgi:hypothetical protein